LLDLIVLFADDSKLKARDINENLVELSQVRLKCRCVTLYNACIATNPSYAQHQTHKNTQGHLRSTFLKQRMMFILRNLIRKCFLFLVYFLCTSISRACAPSLHFAPSFVSLLLFLFIFLSFSLPLLPSLFFLFQTFASISLSLSLFLACKLALAFTHTCTCARSLSLLSSRSFFLALPFAHCLSRTLYRALPPSRLLWLYRTHIRN